MTCHIDHFELMAARRGVTGDCDGPTAWVYQCDDDGRTRMYTVCTAHARQLVCFVDRVTFPAEGIESDRWGDRPIERVVAAYGGHVQLIAESRIQEVVESRITKNT